MSEPATPGRASPLQEVVLVTGISGSGKSVALHALEDAGFTIDCLREPAPPASFVAQHPESEYLLRVPFFLHVRARSAS